MANRTFAILSLVVACALFLAVNFFTNEYVLYAGYIVLQFVVLATAWNILGGYCGYVNFGVAGFFAVGAYVSVALHRLPAYASLNYPPALEAIITFILPLPLPILVLISGAVAGLLGLVMGYLTLRLRGVFFAIATLAMSVVLQTLIVNWDYVGGSRGVSILRPATTAIFSINYIEYLFGAMLVLATVSIVIARTIERSRMGYGFATIKDDEVAAQACGVPTLRLKLAATTISGALMGMAGAPFPYYVGYMEPQSTFSLIYAVNAIAMPMIGGTTSWIGPLIGAVLVAGMQQIAAVTISSEASLLLVGILLVVFVVMAPNGILGWFERAHASLKSGPGKKSR